MTETAANPAKKKRKHKGLRRIIAVLAVLALLGGAGFLAVRSLQAEYTVSYSGYTAARGTISNSMSFTGSMQLVNSKTYTPSSSARVREVWVAVGDEVKEGDRLLRLSNGETMKAEFDGRINRLEVEAGDEVSTDTTLLQLVDFSRMRVSFRVGESDIGNVSLGQSCRVTVPSAGASFETRVATIDYASYSGNNVAYYTATVDVDTSAVAQIYPGMQATIVLPQEEAENVVVLRMDAVSTARDNTAFVYKQQEDGSMAEVPVTVGVSNGNYVEIRAGVSEGETVFAVDQKEETAAGIAGLFSSLFGSQRVNLPSNGWGRGTGTGTGQGTSRPGGSSGNPGSRGN